MIAALFKELTPRKVTIKVQVKFYGNALIAKSTVPGQIRLESGAAD